MNANKLEAAPVFDLPTPVKSSVAICGIFDEDPAKLRAQRVMPHLLSELGDLVEISFSWWRAKLFFHPKFLRMASDAVAHAQVILFSWQTGRTMPLVLTNWLDEALARRKDGERILVALLESGSTDLRRPSLPAACLRRSARKAGADFLFNGGPVLEGQSRLDLPIMAGREVLIGS